MFQTAYSYRTHSVRAFGCQLALVTLVGMTAASGTALAQHAAHVGTASASSCAATNGMGVAALRAPAAKSGLSLCDGHPLAAAAASATGTPLALASADFDEDGVPDLVSGFGTGSAGSITIHRGNVDALWPYGAALRNGPPAAFLPNPHSFSMLAAPDFVVTGDFDGDGHVDIVTAARGQNALYFLKGNGRGGFAAAKRFALAGSVTDLIAGEMNRPDGLADLAVGVTGDGGSAVLVYQSPMGALKGEPESFAVSAPATSLALGKFSGVAMRDLVIGIGSDLALIHGRDRHLSASTAEPVAEAVITKQAMGFGIKALVAGNFTGNGPSIAALDTNGTVHILEHSLSVEAMASVAGATGVAPTMQVAGGKEGSATGGSAATETASRVTAMRQKMTQGGMSAEWSETSSVSLPNGASATAHGLVAGHVTGAKLEDLLVVDIGSSAVHVLSTMPSQKAAVLAARSGVTFDAKKSSAMSMLTSLNATDAPMAVLPMRLNQHGLSGLVALQSNVSSPVVMPQDVPPSAVFTVTNTLDITDPSQKNSPPAGSLRAAMEAAQTAAENNGGGSNSIVFNIPTSDPGYNAATGVWKIQPLSENVPGSLDAFALPPINNAVTIDGYTQPGASPNTLVNADNAKVVIQIDGSKATTPGGTGFSPYFDTGTVLRGMAITGWVTPLYSNGTASGAEGIELNGVSDFVEGNFIGTVDGKTAAQNRIGIFADNGPLSGNIAGNIVGGTTPQARNIISGNNVFGIAFLSIAYEGALQGNFIGLDSTGAAALPNIQDGVGINGPTVTIGGTLPGDRNYIAGNGTNVDINDLTNGGACNGSYVQGNYIGTDATGTVGLTPKNTGVSIVHTCKNYLIGGTTAAARNIISGNMTGVLIEDNSTANLVQGNYIGTDATGAVAVPNGQYGVFTGNYPLSTTSVPATSEVIGGTVAGAANVISGNGSDGISINGSYSTSPGYSPYNGNTIQGNFIGTDVTGTKSVPNKGNGISVQAGGTNNTIGGSAGGAGNVIANNTLNGVMIDSNSSTYPGSGNVTVANAIFSNGGAGVRVVSGTGNRISVNSIYSNSNLGIDIDAAGPSTNTPCNATNSGANMLQNYPVLTAGAGSNYITATATDPHGNTSEFSKSVQATQVANVLSLLGSFNGVANTNFTIEFFSNPSQDPSGYGQGKTYLGSTTIKTDNNCAGTIADPVDLTTADVAVTVAFSSTVLKTGPDFGAQAYNATVIDNGPAIAHNVIFTDTLPAQLQISSTYCNQGPCVSPVVTSQGTCTVSGRTITCALGTVAPGATVNVSIPVQALTTGSILNTAKVSATELDPNLPNNTAMLTLNATDPGVFTDHIVPTQGLVTGQPLLLTVYGTYFNSSSTVTFNGTQVPITAQIDNQLCGTFNPSYCNAVQISVPASLITGPGVYAVVPMNAGQSFTQGANYTAVAACTYTVNNFIGTSVDPSGTNLNADSISVYTGGVANCPWTATSSVPWLQILDNASASGTGTVDIAIAPNTTTTARMGSLTIAGQTFNFSQAAGTATTCSVNMDPAAVAESAAGGTGTINETPVPAGCAEFLQTYPQNSSIITNAAFITVNSSVTFAPGPITYAVAPNNGPARVGAIVEGGNATIITQAAPSCYFTLTPGSTIASSAGATGSITVTPTPSTCSWTATPSDTSQVTVTGSSGTGVGTVNYTVAANTGSPRTPTITIGNSISTSLFTINQVSPNACTFTISPTPTSVSSLGTSNYFTLTASFSFCQYTAASNNPDGVAVTGSATGMGTHAVYYSVAQNTSTAARTLTITAGCQTFTINQSGTAVSNNAIPVLTSLSPSSAVAGSAGFNLTVNGTGFVSGAVVNFNGSARTTTYVSSTQVTAAILASDLASVGTPGVTVTNPTPGGGTSNSLTFTISAANNPTPVLTSLSPSTIAAGSAAFTLTVNGTGFVSGATVNFNGAARVTTFISATQVTAAILATDVASAGTPGVTVTNPTPGGGASNSLTFTISAANNPTPVLTSLSPSTIAAGSAAFTLTVNGTGFVSGATVKFNGTARTTTYVSATQVTAAILASDVASVGTPGVTVTNPTPGGGTSNSLTFTISAANNPTPVLTSLSPSSITAGSASFTLTVNGTGFVSGATVNFNGMARVTTYVSATQVTAAILATDVASVGTPVVTVTNPTPGGGVSNSLTFTVTAVATNPVPTITSLQPNSLPAGSAAFTLTVNGTNFISGSIVTFNGNSRTATFLSATQLTVAIPATDVATIGTPPVVVTNPAPGGGASAPVNFTITGASIASFTLSSSTPAQTVFPGSAVQYSITASAVNGTYSSPIVMSASGIPPGAYVTFSPASITPGSTSATSTMTLQTAAPVAQMHRPGSGWPLLASLFPLAGLLLVRRSRRGLWLMLLLLTACCTGALTGCGGGISYFGSHPQTYNVTVAGTSGGTQQTTTIKLTVNY